MGAEEQQGSVVCLLVPLVGGAGQPGWSQKSRGAWEGAALEGMQRTKESRGYIWHQGHEPSL